MEEEPQAHESQEDKQHKEDRREQRNGSIFAWLLARLRIERHQDEEDDKPENKPELNDEQDEAEAEQAITEAEEAITEAEDVVELRHAQEAGEVEADFYDVSAEDLAEVDYQLEYERAEVVRDDSREIVERVAVSSDSYFDPSPNDGGSSVQATSPAMTEKTFAVHRAERKADPIVTYFEKQRQKRLEKKLKKEVKRHKKRLKTLKKRVNKVQEAKIKTLTGRIADLESDRHEHHFEPRHPQAKPVSQPKETVVVREVVRLVERPKERPAERPLERAATSQRTEASVRPTSKTQEKSEVVEHLAKSEKIETSETKGTNHKREIANERVINTQEGHDAGTETSKPDIAKDKQSSATGHGAVAVFAGAVEYISDKLKPSPHKSVEADTGQPMVQTTKKVSPNFYWAVVILAVLLLIVTII